jgi:hypothetical protein
MLSSRMIQLGQVQLHREVQCAASRSISNLGASWPMFVLASLLQAYTP